MSGRRPASLPMYDLPELRTATDAVWAALAGELRRRGVADVPDALERPGTGWQDPRLLVSQTCGYLVARRLRGVVRIVATPRYRAPRCEGARYRSLIVVGRDAPARSLEELRGGLALVNERESHSGMSALRHAVCRLARGGRFFGQVAWTGGHRQSLARVADEPHAVASVDAVTHALLARVDPTLIARTRVLAETPLVPGLPLVTGADASDVELDLLRAALAAVIAAPELASARAELLLDGIEVLAPDAYRALDAMEDDAIRYGYPEVA